MALMFRLILALSVMPVLSPAANVVKQGKVPASGVTSNTVKTGITAAPGVTSNTVKQGKTVATNSVAPGTAKQVQLVESVITAPIRMIVPRTTSPVTPGNMMDEGLWKDVQAWTIPGLINNSPCRVNTQVRLMFDDNNLYVRFECDEPEIERLKLGEANRDGSTWDDDCVEIMVDPSAQRAKFMHLIAEPKEGCYYDALHVGDFSVLLSGGQVSGEDKNWNPDWKYQFKIDTEGKKWILTASIPFASLNETTPKAGTMWLGNFGRERYATQSQELALWSYGRNTDGFLHAADFGEIYFEQEPAK